MKVNVVSFKNINYPLLLLFAWLFIAIICAAPLRIFGASFLDTAHTVLLLLNYGFMYLIPTIVVCWSLKKWPRVRLFLSTIMFTVTASLLFLDARLYDLYGFHINGFVWNLLTTPGGFDSLGADQTSALLVLKYIAILLLGVAVCFFAARYFHQHHVSFRRIVASFFIITLVERFGYGFAYANQYGPVLSQADHMVLYQPMKMNTFLKSVGYEVKRRDKSVRIKGVSQSNINYPLADIELNRQDKPYNIILLVAESMRYQDLFNHRVMPHSVEFAKAHGSNFTHHYSGGNGTRQGMFSMFYGLYGSYWDSFLRVRQTPVLFDVLNQYGYEYFIYTGARFTYPEFDQTIFGSVPAEKLVETNSGEQWKRDRKNVDMLLDNLANRDKSKPFMGFVFFESTHARYSFPKASALEKDYLKTLDYAGLSKEELEPIIDGMKARYINAGHYVDSQLKRIYDYLIANNMLDDTIVMVTGDHGEEFMEKSRWGHNSSFVEEQVRVPMVVSLPGRKPEVINYMTSHMDVSTTLLQALGVTNPVTDYSLGQNLFTTRDEEMVVVASWSDLGLISNKGKLVIPFKSTTQHKHLAMSKDDTPVEFASLTASLSKEVGSVVANSRKFLCKPQDNIQTKKIVLARNHNSAIDDRETHL